MNTQKIIVKRCLKYSMALGGMMLLTAAPVLAETSATVKPPAPKETEVKKTAAETTPNPPLVVAESPVLSVAALDWNRDRRADVALLVKSGDQADLYLYLSDGKGGLELKLVKKSLVWAGALAGTSPKLTSVKRGILYVDSQNEGIGRNRWSQRLTVNYRNNDFFVIGYTYTARDTLDPNYSLNCDFDLLTGKGIKNKQSVDLAKQTFKLSDWKEDDVVAKQCRNSN